MMDYFALLMNIYIFHNMEEVWESHVIQGSLVVVLGKALLLFAVLIIRNHMEKNLWLCWQIQNGFGLFFSYFHNMCYYSYDKNVRRYKKKPRRIYFCYSV